MKTCRAKELEQYLSDPNVPEARKEQKCNNLRRAEAQYLRFLRTKENVTNFQTVKIIGKGAFGEVRLVQRRTDSKIYALKSLVKSEMVRNTFHVFAGCTDFSKCSFLDSTGETNLRMSARSETFSRSQIALGL